MTLERYCKSIKEDYTNTAYNWASTDSFYETEVYAKLSYALKNTKQNKRYNKILSLIEQGEELYESLGMGW